RQDSVRPSSSPTMAVARRERLRRSSANRWGPSRAGREKRWTSFGSCSGRRGSRSKRHHMAVTAEHGRLVENLAAYALEALEGPERARVEAHVATCPTCSDLLQEYRAVVGVLPRGLELVAPPASAWSAIRAAARERTVREGRRRWALSAPRWLRLAAQAAMALALVGMVFWNVMLQRELARRAPGPAPGPEVEALSRRPGQVVILTGSGVRGASARLFVASDGGHGHLAISGLQPLSRNRT